MLYRSQNDELAQLNTSYLKKKKITGYLNLNQGRMYKRISKNYMPPHKCGIMKMATKMLSPLNFCLFAVT